MIIVVGSGLAAVAATHALVQHGHHVTVVDAGKQLESDRQEIVERMSALKPSAWSKDDLDRITGKESIGRNTTHPKLVYGSSFSFETHPSAVDIRWRNHRGFKHSLALGGLSNVWGAALLPYRQEDIADWPISLEDLIPHYRAVMDFVPGSAVADDLEEILPSYSTCSHSLDPSRQAKFLLEDLEKNKNTLRSDGIHFGRSRLAIRASGDETYRACSYCALCLSGCPYGLIYTSAQTLTDLIKTGKVTYLGNHLVERLDNFENGVRVSGHNLIDKSQFHLQASRVLLGAGVLPTTKIVLDSLESFEMPVTLKDSQYFIYPALRFGMVDGVETDKAHTSSQVFIEIDDPSVSSHLVHLQIYGFSSFLLGELNRTFLSWPLQFPWFRRRFLGRLLIVQGFIHSKESGSLELELKRTSDGKSALYVLTKKSSKALATTLKIGWKLAKQSFRIRTLPLIPGLKFLSPGIGYHSGGTFPMVDHPQDHQTDTLGRLPSMPRVHLVDASIFPSIPATSIAFSVMANAHRIATAASHLESP